MGMLGRALAGAAIGGVLGWSFVPSVRYGIAEMCEGQGLGCLAVPMLVIPAVLTAWVLLAWPLLHLAQVRPAWMVAALGPAVVIGLMVLINVANLRIGGDPGLVFGGMGAFAYGLAAALTTRYGDIRERQGFGR